MRLISKKNCIEKQNEQKLSVWMFESDPMSLTILNWSDSCINNFLAVDFDKSPKQTSNNEQLQHNWLHSLKTNRSIKKIV